MFSPDVVTLRQFYATRFGVAARALITASLKNLWPGAKGDVMLGIGYALPYLEPYLDQAASVMVCMPAQQGAAAWPPCAEASGDGPDSRSLGVGSRGNVVFMSHESELPLPENSVNRILLLHSVEHSEQLAGMMDEIWRILTPGGRVLAIVSNRMGLWARSSRTPFGYGRPFSMSQLRDLMTVHQFTLTRSTSALFIPPMRLRLLWRLARHIETVGKFLCPFIGGVLLVEAEKQLYASIRQPVSIRKTYRVQIPAVKPAMGLKRESS